MEGTIETTTQLEDAIKQISFKNTVLDFKWQFEHKEVIIEDTDTGKKDLAWLVWVTFERPDTITREIGRGQGRKEIIWKGSTISSAIKTCWVLVELMVKHELMEGFNFQNARIFNPHNSVYDLAALQARHNREALVPR